MKVVHYNKRSLRIDESSPLALLGFMVRCPSPVDRTDTINPLKFAFSPFPNNWTAPSFGDCCLKRAEELWSIGKPITLMWSGGIDSTTAFVSLRETMPSTGMLNVRYTQQSIDEYPAFEKDIKPFGPMLDAVNLLPESLFLGEQMVVQGECGDQVFGSDVLENHVSELQDDWRNVFKWDRIFNSKFLPESKLNWLNEDNQRRTALETLEEHIMKAPIDVKNIFDLFWWINFSIKWHWVSTRMNFNFVRTPRYKSTYSFFDTDLFQRWSVENHDIKHHGTWKTYKQPAKDFIYTFTKDEDYRVNKTKFTSLVNAVKVPSGNAPNSLSLVLDDESCYKFSQTIPENVLLNIRND